MYILDTSVIRSISQKKLVVAAKTANIAVSTLSVLEIASHLNDSLDNAKYVRVRGNLLKCQIPTLLDDPFWRLSELLQLGADRSRKEDKVVLQRLMESVADSGTLEALDTKTIRYPDGARASCKEVGAKLKGILAEEEKAFVSHIESLAVHAKLDPSQNGQHKLTDQALNGHIVRVAQSLSENTNEDVDRVFLKLAPYLGYSLYRLYRYANARPRGEREIHIDPNDCEDAYIALNLDLHSSDTLVTNDSGTLEAIRSTVALLNEIRPNSIDPKHVIMSDTELLDMLGL